MDGSYFIALYRARQTVDDFGELVRVSPMQYRRAVAFYLY